MGYIDVAIPGVAGLLCLAAPSLLVKRDGDPDVSARRMKKVRIVGAVLLGIAALYLVIKVLGK